MIFIVLFALIVLLALFIFDALSKTIQTKRSRNHYKKQYKEALEDVTLTLIPKYNAVQVYSASSKCLRITIHARQKFLTSEAVHFDNFTLTIPKEQRQRDIQLEPNTTQDIHIPLDFSYTKTIENIQEEREINETLIYKGLEFQYIIEDLNYPQYRKSTQYTPYTQEDLLEE